MELLQSWIIGITAAAILVSVALIITPQGTTRKVVLLAGGLILSLAVIKPLMSVNINQLEEWGGVYEENYNRISNNSIEVGEDVMKKLIQDKTGAYILNKSQALGIDAEIQVTAVSVKEAYPIPSSCKIVCSAEPPPVLKEELSSWIAAECGINAEHQTWLVGG